jgi:hypothetical protein
MWLGDKATISTWRQHFIMFSLFMTGVGMYDVC